MKIYLIDFYFPVEVHNWWEWFQTTKFDGSSTELIAVENRSH